MSDWHEYGRGADNTEVVVTRERDGGGQTPSVTDIEASFDTTASAQLDLYGLSKVGTLDLTDTDVLDLTADTFTVASGHGLVNGTQVVFHTNGGTAPTGLTSGNTYFVVGVSGDDFQLESTVGGGAISMSGTQANLATEAVILPLSKSWQVYDHLEINDVCWRAESNCPLILKLGAVASVQGIVNFSGNSIA